LEKQKKLKKYDFNISDKQEIKEILKKFDIEINFINDQTSYNKYNDYSLLYNLKKPPEELIGIYLKPRLNPFGEEYPCEHNKYSIEEILKHNLSIEKVYFFWDVEKKILNPEIKIHYIQENINDKQEKINFINKYLIQNKIIDKTQLIELNCYNSDSKSGISIPLPNNLYKTKTISAIYFDDGIRKINEKKGTIENLIKMGNGAKNIYIFSFQENIINIDLGLQQKPYDAINNWKKNYKLYDFSNSLYKENYKEDKDTKGNLKIVNCTITTKNTIYSIKVEKDYSLEIKQYFQKLIEWQKKCYFKPNNILDFENIREKTYSKYNFLYSNDNSGIYFYSKQKKCYPIEINNGIYKFVVKIFDDPKSNNNKIIFSGYKNQNIILNKTDKCLCESYIFMFPPPKKPFILN
jgi:hypothetical protein